MKTDTFKFTSRHTLRFDHHHHPRVSTTKTPLLATSRDDNRLSKYTLELEKSVADEGLSEGLRRVARWCSCESVGVDHRTAMPGVVALVY